MKWTTQQSEVIETRGKNILVSAAAGSGKTAVLVERILQKIMDEENPVNVDQMLIVTFTRAAAAQMREKIHKALEKAAFENPENEHLIKQLTYIHGAQITTIDGFCSFLLKNYYDVIDLNPGFMVGDEAQLKILKAEVIKEVLETWYAKEDEVFYDAVESCCYGNSDDYIEEIVIKLFEVSQSHADPHKWLKNMTDVKKITSADELDSFEWMKEIIKSVHVIARDNIDMCRSVMKICNLEGGPVDYIQTLNEDIEIYEAYLKLDSYIKIKNYFSVSKFPRLKTIRKSSLVDEELKEQVKEVRNKCKKYFDGELKKYFEPKVAQVIDNCNKTMAVLSVIAEITIDFGDAFAAAKEDRNLLDFSDIEHYALDILTQDKNPLKPTQVATQLSEFYDEIFIDEYQDSNDVQEAILTAIANKNGNKPHMFMVGDVKQSIYGFRMAKPDLFIGKAKSYIEEENEENIRIDLNRNFRSRDKVLEFCNYVFERSFSKQVGKIEYTENEFLYPKATYPTLPADMDNCELMIYNTAKEEDSDDDTAAYMESIDKQEAELVMIAKRIKQLTDKENGMLVTETLPDNTQTLRRAKYSDIVILFRGVITWADLLEDVFARENIPVSLENSKGYFSATEVRLVLNLLRIINNPLNDIPFASIMRSFVGGFSNHEMAKIRAAYNDGFLYESLIEYIANEDDNLSCKSKEFIEQFERFREYASYMPTHELIMKIYEESHMYECVLAMNDGKKRRKNLDMLVSRAVAFEKAGSNSLHSFIQIMDKMSTYTIDMEKSSDMEKSDSVTVMTIHKSKGLEFPIVFVAGMGKNINLMDTKNKIVIHQECGLGMDYVNHEHRVRTKTLSKTALAAMIKRETIDEEIRILYVAFTRAKEKLILTGAIDVEKVIKDNLFIASDYRHLKTIPDGNILKLKSYLELVLMTLMKTGEIRKIAMIQGIENAYADCMTEECPIEISVFDEDAVLEMKTINQLSDAISYDYITNFDTSIIYNDEVNEILAKQESIKPYVPEESFRIKVSVSDLKKKSMMENEELDNHLTEKISSYADAVMEKYAMMSEAEVNLGEITAAEIGTMYHKIFEIMQLEEGIQLAKQGDKKAFHAFMKKMCDGMELLNGWEKYIKDKDIINFLTDGLAGRMCVAHKSGKLKREQQFVLGIKASEVYSEVTSDKTVLVQGIIDAYFEDVDGDIVLIDYKTDRVAKKDGEDILKKRYRTQLDNYAKAIERLTHKKVKEICIYSVALNKVVVFD